VASRPKFWPRPRSRPRSFGFGLGFEVLASVWPRSRFILSNWNFSCKNRVKFGNFVKFPAIILNHMLLIIIWYFFDNYFGLGLGLEVLASFNITASRSAKVAAMTTDDNCCRQSPAIVYLFKKCVSSYRHTCPVKTWSMPLSPL